MQSLLITDDPQGYSRGIEPGRILIRDGLILQASWVPESDVTRFNQSLNGMEQEAKERMLSELYRCADALKDRQFETNSYLSTRASHDRNHFLLLAHFRLFITPAWRLVIAVSRFLAAHPFPARGITFNLPDSLLFVRDIAHEVVIGENLRFIFRNPLPKALKPLWLRNAYYSLARLRSRFSLSASPDLPGSRHLLFVLYNIAHHHDVLARLFDLCSDREDIRISVVHTSWGGEAEHAATLEHRQSRKFRVYQLTDFRCPVVSRHSDFYDAAEDLSTSFATFRRSDLLLGLDTKYAWMGRAFGFLRPDACLNIGVFDEGRVMSDVARLFGVPSVNLEYGLAFDDALMESNIAFDVRACLGDDAIALWKRRKDPSARHVAVGFCKLDDAITRLGTTEPRALLGNWGLSPDRRTILFASTHSSPEINILYSSEKRLLVEKLAESCHRSGWNLLVKKHPLEFDTVADDAIRVAGFANQRVLAHGQVDLLDAIAVSDMITSQLSSVVVEAMALDKPFCFLTTADGDSIADRMTLVRDGIAPKFSDIGAFEAFTRRAFSDESRDALMAPVRAARNRYLYRCDGRASERLLLLLLELAAEKNPTPTPRNTGRPAFARVRS